MNNKRLVWTDKAGDLRKASDKTPARRDVVVDEKNLELKIRRLTSGKGRTVIEIRGLPKNKLWCETLAKELKQALGVGGTYKDEYIEIHGEKIEKVIERLEARSLKWKKTGG